MASGVRMEERIVLGISQPSHLCRGMGQEDQLLLQEDSWTAAKPITRARPNSQIFMTSNAGDMYSTVLNNMRSMCLSYPPATMGFWEYSADDFSKITDRNAWYQANPALGYLIDEATIEEAIATSSVEATRTETLCMWISALKSPWPHQAFEDLGFAELKLEPGPSIPTERRQQLQAVLDVYSDQMFAVLKQSFKSKVLL